MVGLGQTNDSRSDQCHGGVTEMTEQSLQPAASRNDVGVQKGGEARLAGGQTGIARCRRPSALCMPQHLDVGVLPRKVVWPNRGRGAVVDNDDAKAAQRGDQPAQAISVVPHWNYDGYIAM